MRILSFIISAFVVCMLFSCQESLEEKAERQAKDYTRKYCPTPVHDFARTDSIVFNKQKKVYTYYVSFYDDLDDKEIVDRNRDRMVGLLQQSIKESTNLKSFVEAGFRFEYVCRSGSNPKEVLLKIGL